MTKFDVQLSVNGNLEWITDIYQSDVNTAIQDAIQLAGKAEYVGHHQFKIQGGEWVEVF